MPRHLAVEWDALEARVVAATARGGRLVVEQAFRVPLTDNQEPSSDPDRDIGARLAAALATHGIRKGDTLATLGRSQVELKTLSLPPAPDDELPEMVRFQARREFASQAIDAALDFVPLNSDPAQQRYVLAAAATPESLQLVRTALAAGGLHPTRIVLRPAATAGLLRRQSPEAVQGVCLLVDVLGAEVDLTVLVDGRVTLLRNARLVGHGQGEELAADRAKALMGEIRRTIASAQNQIAGRKVERIFLAGSDGFSQDLAGRMADLPAPLATFDPFAGADRTGLLPEFAGRYAALVGLLTAELCPVGLTPQHDFDFLNPRKKPAPPSQRRTKSLAVAAAACCLLAVGGWYVQTQSRLSAEIESLKAESLQLTQTERRLDSSVKQAAAIEDWLASDIVWLDEFALLSSKFPKSQDALVTQLSAAATKEGGQVLLKGAAQTRALVGKLEEGLRDDHRVVKSGGVREDKQEKKYPQQFDSTLDVRRQEKGFYAGRLEAKAKADAKAPSKTTPATTAAKSEEKLTDAKATDAKTTDAKPTDTKGEASDARLTETKVTEAKLPDTKPAETH